MKSKDQISLLVGKFIEKKRGKKTLIEYGKQTNTNHKTLHKHEGGVRDIAVLMKHVTSDEELLELFNSLR